MVVCLFALWLTAGGGSGQTMADLESRLGAARKAWTSGATDPALGWALAKAIFDRAEFATNKSDRASLAEQGIQVARAVLRLDTNSAPAHFYLALNLGQLARTRNLSALGLVSEMERHFLASIALDPGFHHAAAERSLGILYKEAPGWPASIGSRSKARQHLERAVQIAPRYPENLLTLLEAELRWGERRKVAARLPAVATLMAEVETHWPGREWESSRKDWIERAERIRVQSARAPGGSPASTRP